MKKTTNKWKTDKCCLCGEPHENYTGKLDKNGVEYVICGHTHKRINVVGNFILSNPSYEWEEIKDSIVRWFRRAH